MGRLTEYFGRMQGRRQTSGADWMPALARERLGQCDAAPSYLQAARDACFASKERGKPTPNAWRRTRKGPLKTGYSETGLTNRQRTAGRAVKVLLACKKSYETGDRTTFDKLVPKLDRLYGILQDDIGSAPEFGPGLRHKMFPKWCPREEGMQAN